MMIGSTLLGLFGYFLIYGKKVSVAKHASNRQWGGFATGIIARSEWRVY
jgi:hypothetical protein|tara:strand:- start:274 stop:420 length:147 start_codon:yes stop_codon:yes gene_type:complete